MNYDDIDLSKIHATPFLKPSKERMLEITRRFQSDPVVENALNNLMNLLGPDERIILKVRLVEIK